MDLQESVAFILHKCVREAIGQSSLTAKCTHIYKSVDTILAIEIKKQIENIFVGFLTSTTRIE